MNIARITFNSILNDYYRCIVYNYAALGDFTMEEIEYFINEAE
jgi:hypothetical protein